MSADTSHNLPVSLPSKGWRVRALKHVANVQFSNVDKHTVEDEVPVQLCNYTDVYKNDLIVPDMDFMQASATPAEIKKFRLRENDVIITKDSETWEDIAIPAHVTASMDGVLCGYHLAQLRPRPDALRGKFLYYCLKARPVAYHFNISAFGITRFGLSNGDIGRAPIPVPPLDTQDDIVTYLDRETRRIDTIIEKNRRLLELIDEKRTAFINNAIRGRTLPHTAAMTAIPWLGQIPAHWATRPIWSIFRLGRGRVISVHDLDQNPGEYPVYSSQTENNGVFGFLNTFDFSGDYITWTTDGANAGTVFRRSGRFNCTNVCGTLKPYRVEVNLDYMTYALSCATSWYVRHDINPKLMNGVMSRIRVPFPPIREQDNIAGEIGSYLDSARHIAVKVTRAIDLLRERRLALISAAVTGKLEVPAS